MQNIVFLVARAFEVIRKHIGEFPGESFGKIDCMREVRWWTIKEELEVDRRKLRVMDDITAFTDHSPIISNSRSPSDPSHLGITPPVQAHVSLEKAVSLRSFVGTELAEPPYV